MIENDKPTDFSKILETYPEDIFDYIEQVLQNRIGDLKEEEILLRDPEAPFPDVPKEHMPQFYMIVAKIEECERLLRSLD